MATIRVTETDLVIEMHGMDKFWALRSSVTIPLAHIRAVEVRPKDAHASNMKGLRVGSYVPGYVLAGYFYILDGVGVNAASVFESLEQTQKAIEAWPEGSGTPRDASHRQKALEHLAHTTEEMRAAAKELGVDPTDKGRGWAFYEVHDAEKTIGIDVAGEKVRRVVIEIEGLTPEAAAQIVDEAARRKR
jgi:hypothetical protein